MTDVEILDGRAEARGGYKVDVTRGARVGRVSSEWFSWPDDERFLSLTELFASLKGRAEHTQAMEERTGHLVEAGLARRQGQRILFTRNLLQGLR